MATKRKKNVWPFGAGQPLGKRTTFHYGAGEVRTERKPATAGRVRRATPRGIEAASRPASSYKGYRLSPVEGGWSSSLDRDTVFESEAQAKRFIDSWVKRNPGAKLGVYPVTMKQGTAVPTRLRLFTSLTNAREAAAKQGDTRFLCEVLDSTKRKVGYVVPAPGFDKAQLTKLVESSYSNPGGTRNQNLTVKVGSHYETVPSLAQARERARVLSETMGYIGFIYRGEQLVETVGRLGGKRNPAAAAAEVYEEFHGTPSTEWVDMSVPEHYHKHLAGLGKLAYLKVAGVDGYEHTVKGFAGAILCSNEERNQLFIEGGDQTIDLRLFGIKEPHEVETLGQVTEIGYQTTKHHLGAEGGKALYFHQCGEDGGSSPDLLYRVRDTRLEFSGGSYRIKAEGIEN